MKGCPFCEQIKSSLTESKIDFVERDIDDYKEEYDLFVEATDNEFVPAFMIIDEVSESPKTFLYAPERDFLRFLASLGASTKFPRSARSQATAQWDDRRWPKLNVSA